MILRLACAAHIPRMCSSQDSQTGLRERSLGLAVPSHRHRGRPNLPNSDSQLTIDSMNMTKESAMSKVIVLRRRLLAGYALMVGSNKAGIDVRTAVTPMGTSSSNRRFFFAWFFDPPIARPCPPRTTQGWGMPSTAKRRRCCRSSCRRRGNRRHGVDTSPSRRVCVRPSLHWRNWNDNATSARLAAPRHPRMGLVQRAPCRFDRCLVQALEGRGFVQFDLFGMAVGADQHAQHHPARSPKAA